jgi:hypothetical protein
MDTAENDKRSHHTFSYAGQGRYGHVWKIYIEAEDPDGDMLETLASTR